MSEEKSIIEGRRKIDDILFYADDVMLAGDNNIRVQWRIDLLVTKYFLSYGFKINASKIYLVAGGPLRNPRICNSAYKRKQTGKGIDK